MIWVFNSISHRGRDKLIYRFVTTLLGPSGNNRPSDVKIWIILSLRQQGRESRQSYQIA
ncbi:MAG: hypothetical protein QOC56_1244 [Alphaproteobacteria bacterium]|nr:hypothetical protein [Alphaproteobacteria bacterium]